MKVKKRKYNNITLNPDAGNVPVNIAFFNATQGIADNVGLVEKFEQHDTLNPAIWNEDNSLKPEIREKLFEIIDQYCEDSQFLKKEDIITALIVGSNASFNYTKDSDLDLHLIVNMSEMSCDPELVSFACNSEKSIFNDKYSLLMSGVNVEVYVEDINSTAVSNGVYDLYRDAWIKKPVKLDTSNIDYELFDKTYEEYKKHTLDVIKSRDIEQINNLINHLYLQRKYSLATEGETGIMNQVFKELRNEGLLQILKAVKTKEKSKLLSID